MLAKALKEIGVKFNSKRRICYSRHIINLSLNTFLFTLIIKALKVAIKAVKDELDITMVEAL